ncbi:hypothetical protein [Tsuneonella suprasediminis]|uniref:hypothetical protein n=1 Tax=Tsuneonella suprasediminis TaxID=2306996 RepID=UPI002F93969B
MEHQSINNLEPISIRELDEYEIEMISGGGRNLTATEIGLVAGGIGTTVGLVGIGVAIAATGPIGIMVGMGAAMAGVGAGFIGIGAGVASYKSEIRHRVKSH